MTNPRQAATQALLQVFQEGAYSNLTTDELFAQLDSRGRAFATALFFGVLERAVTLDWAMGCYSKIKVHAMSPTVREILRGGFYQLLYMPSVPPSAAVNESVALTKVMGEAGASGFVNGVMRAFVRSEMAYPLPKDKLMATAVTYGIPAPLVQQWRRDYGHDETMDMLEALSRPAPDFVRVNTLRTTPARLVDTLAEQGITATACPEDSFALELHGAGNPTTIPAFQQGLFHIQDISSQRCVAALDPHPGMRVLDLCAAPGGKSFTAAQYLQGRGEVVARDLHPSRVALIDDGARRLGLDIHTQVGDATVYDPDLGTFDRVLCDVVCSGYGVIRRKPEIRYKDPKVLDGIRLPQYNILCTALNYLKKDGLLIYSTCTLNPRENQDIVADLLAQHPHMEAASMETMLPGKAWRGDGFFTAALRRTS